MAHKKGKQLVGPYYEGREGGSSAPKKGEQELGPYD